MKHKFLPVLLAFALALSLSACGKQAADDAVGPDGPGGAEDSPEAGLADTVFAETNDISDYLTESGFTSSERAYGTTRAHWIELLGEPSVSAESYDDSYQADCYMYFSDGDAWGHFIEFDYLASDLASDGDSVCPSMIQYVPLRSDDGDNLLDEAAVLDYDAVSELSSLRLNYLIFGMPASDLIDALGEPNNSDLTEWGYASWDMDPERFIAYLDANMNVLYGQRVPLWEPDGSSEFEPVYTDEGDVATSESDASMDID